MADVDDDLRKLVQGLVLGLASHTHDQLSSVCCQRGLPEPPPRLIGGGDGATRTKTQRMQYVFDRLDTSRYPTVLSRFLKGGLEPELRNQAQDILWTREQWPEITTRVRRDIIDALDKLDTIWNDAEGFMRLLRSLWVLNTSLDLWMSNGGLEAEIERHVLRNPDDWPVLELFNRLGALRSSDRRFALFIQGLLSGAVNPDEQHQRTMVEAISPALSHANLKIVEVGKLEGYPDFAIVPTNTHTRPAQLILFASLTRKPDLRLRDVLDRHVELLDDNDALVYDRSIPEGGLAWDDIQRWWADRCRIPFAEAKGDLWRRLRASIPANSPTQQALFDGYYEMFAQEDRMLALLPEVWVHWDPVSKKVRQDDALLTQRMDFLMLLPMHRRVVLEVDGAQHYSTSDGHASPAIYAQTARGDRDLRLSGYEVYRFSGHELTRGRVQGTINNFFPRLLRIQP